MPKWVELIPKRFYCFDMVTVKKIIFKKLTLPLPSGRPVRVGTIKIYLILPIAGLLSIPFLFFKLPKVGNVA